MTKVILVTHCQKGKGTDPGLTPTGITQANLLGKWFKQHQSSLGRVETIFCGTSRRCRETLWHMTLPKTLEVAPIFTPIIGPPESLDRESGMVILADGEKVPKSRYISVGQSAAIFIEERGGNMVFITSRPVVNRLVGRDGFAASEASVYRYNLKTGEIERLLSISEDIGDGKDEV